MVTPWLIDQYEKYIRLNSLKSDDYGGLCSFQKTLFEDWQAIFNFSTLDSKNSNRITSILFTQELCPENSLLWNGFSLVLNSSVSNSSKKISHDFHYLTNVLFSTNNGKLVGFSNETKISEIPILGESQSFAIKIIKSKNTLQIYSSFQNREFKHLYTTQVNLSFGYFSILSQTNGKVDDSNFLYSLKISPRSIMSMNDINRTEIELNRRRLNYGSITRSFNKRRRKINMEKINFYQEEISFNNGILNSNDEKDEEYETKLKDSLFEIQELLVRANQDLTIEELQTFIDEILTKRLNSALQKIEKINSDLKDVKLDLVETWNGVKEQLHEIAVSIQNDYAKIKNEMEQSVVNHLKNSKKIQISFPEEELGIGQIQTILILICSVEFVLYLVFFNKKRMATDGFKKND